MDESHPFYQKLQNSKNILLVRDDVGKAKSCVRDLPHSEHFYGSKLKKDKEGVGAVISSWHEHTPTTDTITEKDFQKLNKMSLDNKLITPKQVSDFVKLNDVRVNKKQHKANKEQHSGPQLDYFGMPNHPGTPMDKVVSFGYGNTAADEAKKIYQDSMPSKRSKQVQEKKEFKMKRFQNVESKFKNSVKQN